MYNESFPLAEEMQCLLPFMDTLSVPQIGRNVATVSGTPPVTVGMK